MRVSPLMFAITLAIGLPVSHPAEAARQQDAPDKKQVFRADQRHTFIIVFNEQPLATFSGFSRTDSTHPHLAATSPVVTGAQKLNVQSVEAKAYRGYLAGVRNTRLNDAAVKLGRPLAPTFIYDVTTNGVALELTNAEADALRAMPGIRYVHADFVRYPLTDRGPKWIKANTIWDGTANGGVAKKGEGVVIGDIDTGINRTHDSFKTIGPADGYTNVNVRGTTYGLCAPGTGNPSLCTAKLIGIYDMTTGSASHEADDGSDNFDPAGNATSGGGTCWIPDPNGGAGFVNECVGHGTHTASTTSGNFVNITVTAGSISSAVQMSGVAPHANLITYKACEAQSSCQGTWLLAAIQQAVVDQVDVINFSIGGGASDPWSTLASGATDDSEAFLNARAAGVTIAAAAGNDGPDPGTLGNPANSPWVLAVAAATHDRAVANRLINMTGGTTPPPGGGILIGSGDTSSPTSTTSLPIVMSDVPLCATDAAGTKPPSWGPTQWTGKIVVCTRGTSPRVAKSANVAAGGGAGMVLINDIASGTATVADNHAVPATHLNYVDGQALATWLAGDTGHTAHATLEGTSISSIAAFGDRLADFSGRGPVIPTGVIKPDVTAPGVNIIAAGHNTTQSNCAAGPTSCYNYLSGTSMATPHVAGSLALLKSAHPTWGPSQLTSAIMLTARASVLDTDGTLATPHEQGSGMVDLSKAVNAGLYLAINDANFRAVNATNAHTLNIPSLGQDNCVGTCSLTRTFTDMIGGGSWAVSSSMPTGSSMTPSLASFTVGNAASQALTFNFSITDGALLNTWVYGSVTLTDTTGSGRPSLTLPVALFASAGTFAPITKSNVDLERGFTDVPMSGLVGLSNPRFVATNLVKPTQVSPSLAIDTSNADPFNGQCASACIDGRLFTIPASPVGGPVTYHIHADINSATGGDNDLYVGLDANNDGLATAAEIVCSSANNGSNEVCDFDVATTASVQQFWIITQRYAGGSGGSQPVNLTYYAAPINAASDGTLVATGPGHTAANDAFNLRLIWDDPSFLPGETRVGYVQLQAVAGTTVARIPVKLTRTAVAGVAPFALSNGVGRKVTLPAAAGSAQDKLYFDVPPGTTSATFTTTASTGNYDLYLARVASPTFPNIDPAPARGSATNTAVTGSGNETVTISNPTPGRWYVTPVNSSGAIASATVTANITNAGAPTLKTGHYFDAGRPGPGIFIDTVASGAQWVVVWYAFLEDGTPTWYYAQAAAPTAAGVWRSDLARVAWNGSTTSLSDVGEMTITVTGIESATVSYNIDGKSGSESIARLGTGSCPLNGAQAMDISGHWFSPSKSGFGYSYQTVGTQEIMVPYLFDGLGFPRWLFGQKAFDGAVDTFQFGQATGFCPTCTDTGRTFVLGGTGTRTFTGNAISNMSLNATLVSPASGVWSENRATSRLSDPKNCQ
ncbi:MAG TPA: S8 family serine peptidase [Arenimonas sp.]|uniref:S8 family serine peptidase n=1 Tax=Arenimonas sp. TaxID=1872635 RepID=UPI002BC76818|nr:S8 family serine peptidase [Arenimonas sp.]HMB56633.1 S8 family serine peptidase [Arenimonas sp.]